MNKVSSGGEKTQRLVYISGYIYWTDTSGTTHPAKNIKVCIYEGTNPDPVCQPSTNNNGWYLDSFETNATNYVNIKVKVFTIGQDIVVNKYNNGTNIPYEYVILNSNIPVDNTIELPSKTFPYNSGNENELLFNKALSVHQSLEMANRYVNSRLSYDNIDELNVVFYEVDKFDSYGRLLGTRYNYINDILYIEKYDAYDWDVICHEYGHYVEDKYKFMSYLTGSSTHYYYVDLTTMKENEYPLVYYTKEKAIKLAWNEGWATFFSINMQRIMSGSSNTTIPNVFDNIYSDCDIRIFYDCVYSYTAPDIIIDIEMFTDLSSNAHSIFQGETNEITIAALLLDLVDGISTADNDVTEFSDSTIWNIVIGDETDQTDGCRTLSNFMNAFHATTELSGSQKLLCMYLLRRYELNPYNVSVTNVGSGSPLVSWTNVSAQNCNMIRVFDMSFNEISTPVMYVTNQTSYNIPASTWSTITANNTAVYIVVEGMTAGVPMTFRYFSSLCIVQIP